MAKLHYTLWVFQALLALLFLLSGVAKFFTPAAMLTSVLKWPVVFFYFIGVCEILGGIGLILPSALRIKPWLTPLAAAGLTIIMIGATVITLFGLGVTMAVLPFVVLVLVAFVAYGRWKLAPIQVA